MIMLEVVTIVNVVVVTKFKKFFSITTTSVND